MERAALMAVMAVAAAVMVAAVMAEGTWVPRQCKRLDSSARATRFAQVC